MRKIESLVIGALVAGSRTPTVSKYAILPWRATRTIAPGMTRLSTSALSMSMTRCRRSEDRPTCSGRTLGRLCASTVTAVMKQSRAAASRAFTLMVLVLLAEVDAGSSEACRPRAPRYQRPCMASSEGGETQVSANLDSFQLGQYSPSLMGL